KERQTLHVMDDKQRIALVETKTVGPAENGDPLHRPLVRYQLGNHLGSASLELDSNAALISYEEYHPYGTTAFQLYAQEVSRKRYRYTGMERDEETGLNYHSARYYALWLGRWCSCDPIGIGDGVNLYRYSKNSPLVYYDRKGDKSAVSEGSVLNQVDTALDAKGFSFNTEVNVEVTVTMPDKSTVSFTRRYDRVYVDSTGDYTFLEAKGSDLNSNRTRQQALNDKLFNDYGGEVKVLEVSGRPPKGHGSKRTGLSFNKNQPFKVKPGSVVWTHAGHGGKQGFTSSQSHVHKWLSQVAKKPSIGAAADPNFVPYRRPGRPTIYLHRSTIKPGQKLPVPAGSPLVIFMNLAPVEAAEQIVLGGIGKDLEMRQQMADAGIVVMRPEEREELLQQRARQREEYFFYAEADQDGTDAVVERREHLATEVEKTRRDFPGSPVCSPSTYVPSWFDRVVHAVGSFLPPPPQ
ncbi:MAG: RHS repeat-associated core domain-containing protein, partial [Candidatus Electrothrix sp. AR1]|nr:RHS repeat-associated core domain-containing protein [Candidatus Electrothrix sp. AR1]